MGDAELTVLVVDDDFRVANMHAGIVNALPGFTVAATVNTLAAAREADAVDLALVDVYLPDGSGVDFVRELRCDSFISECGNRSGDNPRRGICRRAELPGQAVRACRSGRQAGRLRPLPQDSVRIESECAGCRRGTRCASPEGRRATELGRPPRPPPNSLSCRRCVLPTGRCRRRRSRRRSEFRGRRRSGIWLRWPLRVRSRHDCATAPRAVLNRNSSPPRARLLDQGGRGLQVLDRVVDDRLDQLGARR